MSFEAAQQDHRRKPDSGALRCRKAKPFIWQLKGEAMDWKRLILACGLLLCLVWVSCERTQTPGPPERKLSFETIKTQNSIPADYGELEGVVVDSPGFARMFFEKEDKSIVVVTVNMEDGFLRDRVLVIPRK
jgi:hypothetical protein